MPRPRLSDADKRATVKAFRAAGGRVTLAASMLGISRSTLSTRKLDLLADPKWAKQIPPAPVGVAGRERIDGTRDFAGEARREADRHRKRADEAEARLERERAARVKVKPVKPAKARRGPEDFIRVIRPDLHGCNADRAAVAAYLADVKKLRPRELVGLGDLADCGGFLAQHHVWGYVAETDYTFEADVEAVNAFLNAEDEAAGSARKWDIEGNHDHRIEQWCVTSALRRKQDAAFLLKHFSPRLLWRLQQRERAWVSRGEMGEGGLPQGTLRLGKCLFIHGHHTGTTAAASALAAYKMSVVFGHTHRIQNLITTTYDGTALGAWTTGYLAQPKPYWQHGKPTGWAHGYSVQVVARSGAFLHITVPIIDGVSLLPTLKLG